MSIFKDASPTKAGSDLLSFLREQRSDKLPLLIVACIPPAAIFLAVSNDVDNRSQKPVREIIYIENLDPGRTRAEILASNIERQKKKDVMLAQQREAYKALGRAAGMNVDKLETEALAAEAKRKAENAKAIEKSLKAEAGAAQ